MGTTFIELTNILLRRLNEVPLDETNFAGARGLQAAAKEAVVSTIQKINKNPFQWVFTASLGSQVLTQGVNEYNWPSDFLNADWSSFQLIKDDSLNINSRDLLKINREQWYNSYRNRDTDAGTNGVAIPLFVFEGHGNKFGVSPSPDKAYTVSYRYYNKSGKLVSALDECNIPSDYDYVIVAGALYLMKMFKEDTEGMQVFKQEYKEGLSEMRNLLLNRVDTLQDTRILRNTRSLGFY